MLQTLLHTFAIALPQAAGSTPTPASPHTLTAAGWYFMLVSVGGVVVWTAWCFYKVLTAPEANEAPPPSGYGP